MIESDKSGRSFIRLATARAAFVDSAGATTTSLRLARDTNAMMVSSDALVNVGATSEFPPESAVLERGKQRFLCCNGVKKLLALWRKSFNGI